MGKIRLINKKENDFITMGFVAEFKNYTN